MPARADWLPQTVGLLASAIVAILATAPPGHPYTWLRLLGASMFIVALTSLVCALAMFIAYAALPPAPDVAPTIRRTAAIAACFGPLVILLQQTSIWAAAVAAFLVWSVLPVKVSPQLPWKKFIGSFSVAALLQIGIVATVGRDSLLAALSLGIAAAPLTWRIRQERPLRGPFRPRSTILIALLLAILSKTRYLPIHFGSGAEAAYARGPAPAETKEASAGFSKGGKYRGVILIPEAEKHTILVPPLPMMGRNPFILHEDPISIPFYGVYWFFQPPDNAPNKDAYKVKGTPDNVTFRSADRTPLRMEARQNLGRLIDLSACSRIDIAIRNADNFGGSISVELVLVNTSLRARRSQTLGQVLVASKPPAQETLSFKIPASAVIQQFDEMAIRFHRAPFRGNRSAKIAIERFFLVPRER